MKLSWRRFAFFKKEGVAEEIDLARRVCGGSSVGHLCYFALEEQEWLLLGLKSGVLRAVDVKDVENVVDIAVFRGGSAPMVSGAVVDGQLVVFAVGCDERDATSWLAMTMTLGERKDGETLEVGREAACCKIVGKKRRLIGCVDGSVMELDDFSRVKQLGWSTSMITNLEADETTTFATSHKEVYCIETSRKLDERGCEVGCCGFLDEQRLAVARQEAIVVYSKEERLMSFGIDGDKQCLACLGTQAIVASRHDKSRRSEVHVYDLSKQRVAHFHRLPAGQTVAAAAAAGRAAAIATTDGCLSLLREFETRDKLEVLYRMNLYPTAVEVATSANLPAAEIMDIYTMYGDHLYKKCDWAGAAEQYARAIGRLEPSYVVSRFLEAQRLHNLADYLETWHRVAPAMLSTSSTTSKSPRPELTALLVNCYAKLKDVAKLDALASGVLDVDVDATVAVEALAEAGYGEHALQLAAHRSEHLAYAKLAARSCRLPAEAVVLFDHVKKIDNRAAQAEFLLKYGGKRLVADFPEQATELLMRIFGTATASHQLSDEQEPPSPQDFVHLFVDRPKYLRVFLEYIKAERGEAWLENAHVLSATLLELMLDEWRACADDATLTDDDPLEQGAGGNSTTYEERLRQKGDDCMRLLEDGDYEPMTALVLVESRGFDRGRLFLFENVLREHLPTGLVDAVLLESYSRQGRVDHMLRVARRSPDSTLLWQDLVTHAVRAVPRPGHDAFFDKCDDLQTVLSAVDQERALKPLRCLSACANNPNVPLLAVRPYLARLLANARDALHKTRAAVAELQASTQTLREPDRLTTLLVHPLPEEEPAEDNSTVSADGRSDDDATAMDAHSSKWHEIKRSQRATAHDHELFFKQLEDPENGGFDTVATYFGKGVIR